MFDHDKFNAALKEAFPDIKMKSKNEGSGFVAVDDRWVKYRKADGRAFIPDAPIDTVLDGTVAARLQRRELVLDHKDVSPAQAAENARKVQEFTLKYVAENYPGMRASFHPKYVEDATKLWTETQVKSAAKYLEAKGFINDASTISSLEDLAAQGVHMVKSSPGNGRQSNYSVVDAEGNNLIYDKEKNKGNVSFLAMAAGVVKAAAISIFPFCSTKESYKRHGSHSKDEIQQACEDAECRPVDARYGNFKWDCATVRPSPYTPKEYAEITTMVAARGAAYVEERNNDTFRLETRQGDQHGNHAFSMAVELASMYYGLMKHRHDDPEFLEAKLNAETARRPLARSMPEAFAQFEKSGEMKHMLSHEPFKELHEVACQWGRKIKSLPARGNDNLIEYLSRGQEQALAA